jgi:hypothetical protein
MTMFGLYLNILALSVSVSTFAVLAAAALQGHAVTRHDLMVPIAIQVLLTSLVFIVRELVRRYESRIACRVFIHRTGAQLADFKAVLLHHRQGFSKGFKTWNS